MVTDTEKYKKKLLIVVPYRDRQEQLNIFQFHSALFDFHMEKYRFLMISREQQISHWHASPKSWTSAVRG